MPLAANSVREPRRAVDDMKTSNRLLAMARRNGQMGGQWAGDNEFNEYTINERSIVKLGSDKGIES